MKKLKHYFPNYILSVLLVFFIIGLSIISLISCVLKPSFFIDSAKKHNIYQRSSDYTIDYFEKSYAVSNIPADVYMNGLGNNVIKQATNGKINAFFDYVSGKTNKIEKSEVDYSELEKSISDYFDKFAKENNVEINDLFKTQLDNTITAAKKDVNSFTNIYMLDYIEKAGIHKKLHTIYPMISIAVYILSGGILLCAAIMFLLNKKEIKAFFYWFAVSGLCSSVIGLIPCIIIKKSDYFSRLIMRTDYIYYAVTGLLNDSVNMFIKTQIIILAASVLVMAIFVIFSIIENRKKQ